MFNDLVSDEAESMRVELVAGATWGAGRAIAAGTIISSRQLAEAYGTTDTDGSRPDRWGYLTAYGWERDDGAGIEDFR